MNNRCIASGWTALLAASFALAQQVTVNPVDNKAGLRNPDMGWYIHYYDNNLGNYGSRLADTDVLDYWPGMTTIYYRLAWKDLEPQKGQFNWGLIDKTAKNWIAAGRKIAFRVTAKENYEATPAWVGTGYAPTNPTFLAALEDFLKVFGARYDGKPYVAHVDVGSIGIWGEGWDEGSLDAKKKAIDLYAKYFPNTMLAVNDDYGGEACDYARMKGFTLRDDSFMLKGCANGMFDAFWRTKPTIIETDHYGTCLRNGNWSLACFRDIVENTHASWVDCHGWPDDFWAAEKALIDTVNLRVGYRLQVTQASWPASALVGQVGTVFTMKWRNAGVAPCYKGGFPTITIKDASGKIVVSATDTLFDVKQLQPGSKAALGPVLSDSVRIRIPPGTPAGQHTVFVSVGAKDGTPIYELPYNNDDGSHRYPLGAIPLMAASDNTPPSAPGNCSAQAVDDKSVRLSWSASSDPESGVYGYIIYRDGQKITETAATFYADQGLKERTAYTYEISATNLFGMESQKCQSQLTTPADAAKPTLVSATAMNGATSVTVTFSEPIEQQTAQNAGNYGLSGGITISSAVLQSDPSTVVLATSAMTGDVTYTLTVSNVRDRAQTPNTIVAGSSITFKYMAGISKIRFFPRPGLASRMAGGIFEGTNGNKDTGPYTALYTVSSPPIDGQWTEVAPAGATIGYRYVRYRAAGFCNVAEIEFYRGTQNVAGTVFGTPGSWGNSGNDYTKAFDGNTTTFMDFTTETGGYTGLDLQSGAVVIGRTPSTISASDKMAITVTGRRISISGIDKHASIGIYDLRGNLVRSTRNVSAGVVEINGPHEAPLANGHYILRISTGSRDIVHGIWVLP